MADLSVLKNIVRTGRVSSVNAGNRTARVTFEDKGQSPLVSGELKVRKSSVKIRSIYAVHSGKESGTEDGKRKRRKR